MLKLCITFVVSCPLIAQTASPGAKKDREQAARFGFRFTDLSRTLSSKNWR